MTTERSSENTEIDEAFVQNLLDRLKQEPAQFDLDTYKELEAKFDGIRLARRMSLLVLTKPFIDLHDQVVADRGFAIAVADLYEGTKSTLDTIRGSLEIMECAEKWMMMALACREDMPSVLEEVRAK